MYYICKRFGYNARTIERLRLDDGGFDVLFHVVMLQVELTSARSDKTRSIDISYLTLQIVTYNFRRKI